MVVRAPGVGWATIQALEASVAPRRDPNPRPIALRPPRTAPPPPAELVSRAVVLLRQDSPELRRKAAQLLAEGWAQSEELRLAELRTPIEEGEPGGGEAG